jgi:hypothetical protein
LVRANGLTIIPADVDLMEPGQELDVLVLDRSRGEGQGSYLSES